MACASLTEGSSAFNQSSLSSRAAFQLSERIANLELSALLLEKAKALMAVALENALSKCTQSQRYHYLAALEELIVAVAEQIEEVLVGLRPKKLEE